MSTQSPFGGRTAQAFPTLPRGDVLGTYDSYPEAQRVVAKLAEADFPVAKLAIVGNDLKTVERVTGKMTYGRAALAGALSGLWLGFFFGIVLTLFSPSAGGLFAAAAVIGAGFGMLYGIVSFAITKRQRDFTSVHQVLATNYQIVVEPQLSGGGAAHPRAGRRDPAHGVGPAGCREPQAGRAAGAVRPAGSGRPAGPAGPVRPAGSGRPAAVASRCRAGWCSAGRSRPGRADAGPCSAVRRVRPAGPAGPAGLTLRRPRDAAPAAGHRPAGGTDAGRPSPVRHQRRSPLRDGRRLHSPGSRRRRSPGIDGRPAVRHERRCRPRCLR
ncbi:general stress protein [Curtobacterium sp. MCPF17_052]|uniref:general stress protein n=1 Tax=Curtobacterium sp. MCPF17_052 TaxID=2175655 RepID=UPI0024DF5E4C|nr:general stress protein [Curtobacterium sp. MCPF17_052]WIB12049.1 hypothetical protein DEJ36_14755 [Curtobacterium sp. MCPF17_052]